MPSRLSPPRASRGFTMIELMIYAALTAVIVGMFAAILITVTNVQNRQSSSSKATSEMGFLMTTMQRLVHEASGFTLLDAHTLVLASSTPGATKTLAFDEGAHSITQTDDDGVNPSALSTLSTTNIQINDLTFTEFSSGASKTVHISLTATVFPDNATQKLTRTLETTAALYIQEP